MSIPRSLSVRRVLVDSSAYYAYINRKSEHYTRAVGIFEELASTRRHLITTNFIVAETHALVLNRLGRDIAARILTWIDDSTTRIIPVTEEDEKRAREIIFTQTDKDYTLADATSFAVMERYRIETAFTLDRHFVRFGFAVIGLDEL
jgi:predicted nucleic acid-binding protein